MADRAELGQEKFGIPAHSILNAIRSVLDESPWNGINKDAVEYYLQKVPMEWLPELADGRMTEQQLEQLSPAVVQNTVFLLTRDMFRHNRQHLVPSDAQDWDENWVEDLFDQIASRAQLDAAQFTDWQNPFPIDDSFNQEAIEWAVRLAKPFSVEPEKLAFIHEAIVEGVVEDVLEPNEDEEEDFPV